MNAPADNLRTQAQVFKSLGHPARLRMVQLLADGERCVCDLTGQVGLDISTISKHLAVLVQAGVLVSDKRANKVFYRLRTPCVLKMFTCLGEVQRSPDSAAPVEATCCS